MMIQSDFSINYVFLTGTNNSDKGTVSVSFGKVDLRGGELEYFDTHLSMWTPNEVSILVGDS